MGFFEELESFLRDLNRQIGLANRLYSEYAVERLEVCIHSVSSLVDLLHSRSPSETSTDVVQLSVQLAELLQCLRRIFLKWQAQIDGEEVHAETSYTAPVNRSTAQVHDLILKNKSSTCSQCVFRGCK